MPLDVLDVHVEQGHVVFLVFRDQDGQPKQWQIKASKSRAKCVKMYVEKKIQVMLDEL